MGLKTLKQLLKQQPFNIRYNSFDCGKDEDLLKVGRNDLLYNNAFYNQFMKFTLAALNEKRERELNKRLRWIIDNEYGYRGVRCPKCGSEYECFYEDIKDDYQYCPHCGQRLLPPKDDVL